MVSYASIDLFKNQTGLKGSKDDSNIELLLEAASRSVDDFCNRRDDGFVADTVATARLYNGTGFTYQWIDECVAVTAVAVKQSVTDATYTAWAAADTLLATGRPENPNFNRTPYNLLLVAPTGNQTHFISGKWVSLRGFRPEEDDQRGRGAPTVQVTAKWGFAVTVPAAVKQATLTLAARWFKRGESAWADVVSSTDFMQLNFRRDIDPDVKFLLVNGRYRRPTIGGREF